MDKVLTIAVLIVVGIIVQKLCNWWLRRHTPVDLLSMPLYTWSEEGDHWTLRDAVEGMLILGATGSGKSSGSGRVFALTMLEAGFGGLVLTAKADERRVWEQYVRECGREEDLVIFGPNEPHRFNALDFELNRKGAGAGITENIVSLLSTILEVAERNSAGGGGSGREDEGYWKRANRQLCRNVVDLLVMAKGRITVPDLYRAVVSAPHSMQQFESEAWRASSFCYQCLVEADGKPKTIRQRSDFRIVVEYFTREFPQLNDKTRTSIVSTFTSMIDVLNRGVLGELFSGETTITPEATEAGKIILIDLPVKEFAEVGQFAQVLWKRAFQRSIERRNIAQSPRPVFLWADEAQHFVVSYDQMFQTTCRSARVATVLLSQSYSNFIAALGGSDKGQAEADALLLNLNTKIFHASAGGNDWAANLIGRSRQFLASGSTTLSQEDQMNAMLGIDWLGQPGTASGGYSETFEYEVQPSAFTQLRTGGPANDFIVEAIVFRNGRTFRASGRSWLRVAFTQKYKASTPKSRKPKARPVAVAAKGA